MKPPKPPGVTCNKCGRPNHDAEGCSNTNLDANLELSTTFTESAKGKEWAKLNIAKVPVDPALTIAVIRKQRADGIARPKHVASQNSKKVS
jgi:hypothetical protein